MQLPMATRSAPAQSTMRPERIYVGYLALQAVLGCVWWVLLATSSTVRSWLELMPERHAVTDAFVFADLLAVALGSAVSAWAIERRASWAVPAVAFTAGSIVYPTLFLLGWVGFTGEGGVDLVSMAWVSTITCWIAYQTWRTSRR